MTIQNIAFAISDYGEMYFRGGLPFDNYLKINKGERVSLDTYFNSLDVGVLKKYTSATKITLSLQITGSARLSLCTYDGESEKIITQKTDTGCVLLEVELESLPESVILYPVIEAECDLSLLGGEYLCDAVPSKTNIAIAICTYKRESAVLKNIEVLRLLKGTINTVYVVDNGQSLDVKGDDYIKILPNKNLGGSGGFTRGLIEAKNGGHEHVILMDDDIEINKESIFRMASIVSILKSECKNAHISASMLPLSKPYMQFEAGARFNGQYIESFKQGLDLREKNSLVKNLKADRVEYGAWWCFLLPISDVSTFGLPLPLFIKFDDVEYGTRCCKNAPIITSNGLCVIHEDFDAKYSPHLEYYTIRNQLITLATQGKKGALNGILRLAKVSAKHLFLYRYDLMPLIFKAFEDFLQGASLLLNSDEERLNREIMSLAPKAKPLSELDGWREELRAPYEPKGRCFFSKLFQVLTLGGHLIPSFMLKKKISAFPLPNAKVGSAYLRKRTIQYQLGSDFGYAYNRSVRSFFKWFFKCFSLSFKLLFKYGKAKRSFKNSKELLTSEAFWKKHLN
ncbi:MAG: glycosyltransferase [Clostridia bacterium]|nr:glycosyltransferase [Clostridia bacterium]